MLSQETNVWFKGVIARATVVPTVSTLKRVPATADRGMPSATTAFAAAGWATS